MHNLQDSGDHISRRSGYRFYNGETSQEGGKQNDQQKEYENLTCNHLTSGLICPQRLHFFTTELVMFNSSDHLTPGDRDGAPPFTDICNFVAQKNPVPTSCGGSSTKPGDTVHAK
jgi:hypothetical protein